MWKAIVLCDFFLENRVESRKISLLAVHKRSYYCLLEVECFFSTLLHIFIFYCLKFRNASKKRNRELLGDKIDRKRSLRQGQDVSGDPRGGASSSKHRGAKRHLHKK